MPEDDVLGAIRVLSEAGVAHHTFESSKSSRRLRHRRYLRGSRRRVGSGSCVRRTGLSTNGGGGSRIRLRLNGRRRIRRGSVLGRADWTHMQWRRWTSAGNLRRHRRELSLGGHHWVPRRTRRAGNDMMLRWASVPSQCTLKLVRERHMTPAAREGRAVGSVPKSHDGVRRKCLRIPRPSRERSAWEPGVHDARRTGDTVALLNRMLRERRIRDRAVDGRDAMRVVGGLRSGTLRKRTTRLGTVHASKLALPGAVAAESKHPHHRRLSRRWRITLGESRIRLVEVPASAIALVVALDLIGVRLAWPGNVLLVRRKQLSIGVLILIGNF